MINLIKMNLYKLFHTKCMFIILFIAMGFSMLMYYINFKYEDDLYGYGSLTDEQVEMLKDKGCNPEFISYIANYDISPEIMKEIENGTISEAQLRELSDEFIATKKGEGDNIRIGITTVSDPLKEKTILSYILEDIASGLMILFLSIATALFVNADEKNGYIKNIAGQTRHRSYIFLSKIIIMALYSLFFLSAIALTDIVACKLFGGSIKFSDSDAGEMGVRLLIAYLITVAYVSGVAMLTSVMRSSTLSMVIGIIFTLGFEYLIFGNLDKLFDTEMYKYLPIKNLADLSIIGNDVNHSKIIGIGIVFFLVYNIVGTVITEKRDAV